MSDNKINRRSFLKIMGWSSAGAAVAACDMPTTVTLEEGKETVVSYLVPEEYVIPGIGVWYASTCQQCPSGCGIQGRVREGRVLKLEGNPESPINAGKLCQMGQAGLQNHYNPDRIRVPMMRKNNALVEVSWDDALRAIAEKVGSAGTVKGDRVAWVTGTTSGHQRVLLDAYLQAMGGAQHFAHEVINDATARAGYKALLGVEQPMFDIGQAKAILSLGADLVGASVSPIHFSQQYAAFRSSTPRGVLMQAEPSMSLTGANADLWMAVRPGTEGALALGIANLLVSSGVNADALPADLRNVLGQYTPDRVAEITGVAPAQLQRVAATLKERTPSLVLTGSSAEGHVHGYATVAAATMLNALLGNIGKTITASTFPFAQLQPNVGTTASLLAFAEAADKGAFDVVFFHGTNPVYTAPAFLKLEDKLGKIPFKVALAQFHDETVKHADVVLPLASALEDWGSHVAAYQPAEAIISLQQPLMEKLYPETRGFGDILLTLLKQRNAQDYGNFADYYAYLHDAFKAMPADFKGGLNDEVFWTKALQTGVIRVGSKPAAAQPNLTAVALPSYERNNAFPYQLVPAARLHMWDGRHANIPWLQEAPDYISKVVWDSWAEIHPKTASKLGVNTGDMLAITSENGATVEVPVYVYRGVHPDVIAVPMGQGHEEYGRYAKGRGVNPLKLVGNAVDGKTGELALHGTRVKAARAGSKAVLVRFGGSETQVGRKLVATVTADVFNRTESHKGA